MIPGIQRHYAIAGGRREATLQAPIGRVQAGGFAEARERWRTAWGNWQLGRTNRGLHALSYIELLVGSVPHGTIFAKTRLDTHEIRTLPSAQTRRSR